MLDTGDLALLVDCGLVQGDQFAQAINAEPFAYDPKKIDVLLVTHAHADHIGRIPKLVKDGFRGKIYSTIPTKELAAIMFDDALHIMQYEAERDDRQPLYSANDIELALSLWDTLEYHESTELGDGVSVELQNAGHILGSAMVHLSRGGTARHGHARIRAACIRHMRVACCAARHVAGAASRACEAHAVRHGVARSAARQTQLITVRVTRHVRKRGSSVVAVRARRQRVARNRARSV